VHVFKDEYNTDIVISDGDIPEIEDDASYSNETTDNESIINDLLQVIDTPITATTTITSVNSLHDKIAIIDKDLMDDTLDEDYFGLLQEKDDPAAGIHVSLDYDAKAFNLLRNIVDLNQKVYFSSSFVKNYIKLNQQETLIMIHSVEDILHYWMKK
jgi:hypothetical protein